MIEASREVADFVGTHQRADLDADPFLARGLVKTLEIIGEAASKVTRNFRESNPEIEWRDLIDMRNHLTHDYFAYDLDNCWTIATSDIPRLLSHLESIVQA